MRFTFAIEIEKTKEDFKKVIKEKWGDIIKGVSFEAYKDEFDVVLDFVPGEEFENAVLVFETILETCDTLNILGE